MPPKFGSKNPPQDPSKLTINTPTKGTAATGSNPVNDAVMQGYLLKLGSGVYKRWQKRYFVCNGYQLYYFSNDKDYREGRVPHHKLDVGGAKLQLLSTSPEGTKFDQDEHRHLCFEFEQALAEKNQRGKYYLVAPDAIALKKWMLALSSPFNQLTDSTSFAPISKTDFLKPSAGEQEFADRDDAEPSVSRVERARSASTDSLSRLRTSSTEHKSQPLITTITSDNTSLHNTHIRIHSPHRLSVENGRGRSVAESSSTELEGFRESFEGTIEGELRAITAEVGSDDEYSNDEDDMKEQKGPNVPTKRARADYVLPDRLLDYFFVIAPPQLLEKNPWDPEEQDFFDKAEEHTWQRTQTQSSHDTDSDEKSSQSRDSVVSQTGYTQRGSQFYNENSLLTTTRQRAVTGDIIEPSKLAFEGHPDAHINPVDLAAVDVYPDREYEGNPFDPGWVQFAFPVDACLRPHTTDQPVRCHWAVITSGTQKRTIKLYFAFLTFAEYHLDGVLEQEQEMYIPKALALVSHYPQFEFMRYCLMEIFASRFTIPIERVISWLISEVPLPSAGVSLLELPFARQSVHCGLPSIQMPLASTLPLKFLFQKLSLPIILEMFKSVMTEGRILFHSCSLSSLVIVCQSLCQLIYPFEWNGIFIPLVPEGSLAACGVLGPFVLGIHSDLLVEVENELDGVLVVDIDNNSATHKPFKQRPDDNSVNLPANAFATLSKSLRLALRHEAQRMDDVSLELPGSVDTSHVAWNAFDAEVLQAFLKFFNEILSGYRKVIFRIAEGPQCNVEEFLREKGDVIDADAVSFITTLFNSTMFMVFLERDKEYENEPLLKLYHDYIASPRDKMLAIQSFKQIVNLSTGAGLSASMIPLPSVPPYSPVASPSELPEQKSKIKFRRVRRDLFGENLTRQQLSVAPSRKFVAYRRASVGQQRSEEGESVLTIMMDIFHAKPINESDYKLLIKCCTSSPQTVTTIVQQSMSNKNLAGAGGLVLSPASFVVLVFVFRYVLMVCAARNKIQHEIVNTVFEACSFYHCHELGKLSSESTETGTLKKQRYYMSGSLSHAFGKDDQRSRDFWVKLISAELRVMIRARKRSAASSASSSPSCPISSSSPSSPTSRSCLASSASASSPSSTTPNVTCSSSSSSATSSSSSSSDTCSSSSSSSTSAMCASSYSSSSSDPPPSSLSPKDPTIDSGQKKSPPPPPPTRSRRHHSVAQSALKSPYRQTPGLQLGDVIVVKTPLGDKEGTVEFLGTTGFCVGDWVGICTKNGSGDCDGSRDGRVYFVCDPMCGLFVLESQVLQNKGSTQERALAHKTEDRLPQETVYHVMLTYITRMKDFRVHKATSEAVCQAVCDAHGMEERLKLELVQTIVTMYRMDSSLEEVPPPEPDYSSQSSTKAVLDKDTPIFLRGRLRVQLLVKSSTAQLRKQAWADVECVLTDSCFAWVHADRPDAVEKSIAIGNIHTIKRISKPNTIEIRPKGKELSRVCLLLGYTVNENGRGKLLPVAKNVGKKELKETIDRENNVLDEWLKWLKLMKMVKGTKKEDPNASATSHRIRERTNERTPIIGRKQVRGASLTRGTATGGRH